VGRENVMCFVGEGAIYRWATSKQPVSVTGLPDCFQVFSSR
jgi:hypothetical protein